MRAATGLSQKKVADALKIAASSVAQWEIGRSKPEIDKLPLLATIYGVSLEELCGADFPAAAQSERLKLLRAFDQMDHENQKTLLHLAVQLAGNKCAAA